jgi:hypothetical protein
MRRDAPLEHDASVLIHPSFQLEIARQRHQDLLARAKSYRLARASRLASAPKGTGVEQLTNSERRIAELATAATPRSRRPCS